MLLAIYIAITVSARDSSIVTCPRLRHPIGGLSTAGAIESNKSWIKGLVNDVRSARQVLPKLQIRDATLVHAVGKPVMAH